MLSTGFMGGAYRS